MVRSVSVDHILFNECIECFRYEGRLMPGPEGRELNGYILLDFAITKEINIRNFTIHVTKEIHLPGSYMAFVTPVTWRMNLPGNYAHLFTNALASIISFITGRPAKSTRNMYYKKFEREEAEVAMLFPVLVAGPGANDTNMSKEYLEKFESELINFVEMLYGLDQRKYIKIMKSVRLSQLAYLNKRDDFSLFYYLLVSSIEVCALQAIKRNLIKEGHASEAEWEIFASKGDLQFNELFKEYKRLRGGNQYSTQRFSQFVFNYCPFSKWDLLPHPEDNKNKYSVEQYGVEKIFEVSDKQWDEVYPAELNEEQLTQIVKDSYKYRSLFTHNGEAPPHTDPLSRNRFLDIVEVGGKTHYLINFRLLSFINRTSIFEYVKELSRK